MRLEDEAHWVGCRWRSRGDEPWWYVSFLMVEIEGRLECVGMDIRPLEDDALMPLRAGTLRELPFASVLTMARREEADSLTGRAKWWGTLPAPGSKVDADAAPGAKVVVDPDDARILALIDQRMAALMNPPEHKVGRHARYTRADLEDVARRYPGRTRGAVVRPPRTSPRSLVGAATRSPSSSCAAAIPRSAYSGRPRSASPAASSHLAASRAQGARRKRPHAQARQHVGGDARARRTAGAALPGLRRRSRPQPASLERSRSPRGLPDLRRRARGGDGARQVILPERFRTKKAAAEALTRELGAELDGIFVEPDKLTVGEYLVEHWLPSIEESVRATTLISYRAHVERHLVPLLGDVPLRKLSPTAINAFNAALRSQPRKPRSPRGGTKKRPEAGGPLRAQSRRAAAQAALRGHTTPHLCDPRHGAQRGGRPGPARREPDDTRNGAPAPRRKGAAHLVS